MKSCEKCKFYQTPRGVQDLGRCRYNPPSLSGEWPTVYTDDWCGKWDAATPLAVTASTAEQSTTTSAQVETTDTEPFEDRVYADALADFEKLAERKRRRGAGYTANPLAHFERHVYNAAKRYAELVASGTESAEAAHQVNVEFGFDDRTAMVDSRDSAGV